MKLEYVPYRQLKKLLDRPALLADACRINALYMVSLAGRGHLGTSLSSMEAIVAIRHLMKDGDLFLSSKGHDSVAQYAVLIAHGILPEEMLHEFRRSMPGHPTVEVKGIVANTGSLGMGLSKAAGLAMNTSGTVYVLLGDGEMMEGQNWEAAMWAGRHKSNVVAVVDVNGLSQDGPAFSLPHNIQYMFVAAGWDTFNVSRANEYENVEQVLLDLDIYKRRPAAILLRTTKG